MRRTSRRIWAWMWMSCSRPPGVARVSPPGHCSGEPPFHAAALDWNEDRDLDSVHFFRWDSDWGLHVDLSLNLDLELNWTLG